MFTFSTKTRGDSSYRGKERVYFTCHPGDFEACFAEISADIHKTQNCAIYYKPSPELALPSDELQQLLGDMKLVVVPITYKLLTTENEALDAELRFALDKHIPLLPLMQEPGLVELFNQKFGGVQFLDKYARDDSAISFDKKLEDFLKSILYGDKLTAKIRAEFDGQIFLSYRKKDRALAQKLMERIHSQKPFRDIAIWYDEYLAIGKDFEDSINTAMKSSQLVTLLVTQNLLEPGNYVLTREYKDACDLQKPVLPVQMAETDQQQMYISYPGLPEIVDGNQLPHLSVALHESLQGIADPKNDDDPQHNYYIGLAYLGGVDVEVNRPLAVELITKAAEGGWVDAMQKLVEMYRNGRDVAKNLHTATYWQHRMAAYWKGQYEKLPCDLFARNYLLSQQIEGVMQYILYQVDAARQVFLENVAFCQGLGPSLRHHAALAYEELGKIESSEGHLKQALEYYRKGLEIREECFRADPSWENGRRLVTGYIALAELARNGELQEQAGTYIRMAMENLNEAEQTAQDTLELADCQDALARELMLQKQYPQAQEYYEKSLKLREAAARASGAEDIRLKWAESCDHLGDLARSQKELPQARAYYDQARAIREECFRETQSDAAKLALSESYRNEADLALSMGEYALALEYKQKRIQVFEEFLRKKRVSFHENLMLALDYRAAALIAGESALSRKGLAWRYYRKSLALYEAQVQQTGSVQAKQGLADCCMKMSQVAKSKDNLRLAEKYLSRCLDLREELLPQMETPEELRRTCEMYHALSKLQKALGRTEQGRDYYEVYLAFQDILDHSGDNAQERQKRAAGHCQLARAAVAAGKATLARYHCEKVLDLVPEGEAERPRLALLAEARRCLTESALVQGHLAEAMRHYGRCVSAYQQLKPVEEPVARQLFKLHFDMGLAAWKAGEPAQASVAFENCIAASQRWEVLWDRERLYQFSRRQNGVLFPGRMDTDSEGYWQGLYYIAESWRYQGHITMARLPQQEDGADAAPSQALGWAEGKAAVVQGQRERARSSFALAHLYWEARYHYQDTTLCREPLTDIYTQLAALEQDEELARACEAIASAWRENSGITQAYLALAALREARSNEALEKGDFHQAEFGYKKNLELYRYLPGLYPVECAAYLPTVYRKLGRTAQAQGFFSQAEEIFKRLLPDSVLAVTEEKCPFWAQVYEDLAAVCRDRVYFRRAARLWKQAAKAHPQKKAYAALAKRLKKLYWQCIFH